MAPGGASGTDRRRPKDRVFTMLEEVWERTADIPEEELEADVDEALEQLRRELLA